MKTTLNQIIDGALEGKKFLGSQYEFRKLEKPLTILTASLRLNIEDGLDLTLSFKEDVPDRHIDLNEDMEIE